MKADREKRERERKRGDWRKKRERGKETERLLYLGQHGHALLQPVHTVLQHGGLGGQTRQKAAVQAPHAVEQTPAGFVLNGDLQQWW